MPFVANQDDDEQQNTQGVSPAGGAVHLSPSSGVGTASPGGSSAAPTNPSAGGSFATLNTYLNANQGQAQPIADKITGQIGQQYASLDQANQGVLNNVQGQVTNAPGYTANNPDVIAQESANPVSFASDQGNVKNFQNLLNDTYSGPASAEGDTGYQSQQANINNAISQGQAQTQTDAGRQGLVAQNSAKPTQGVVALNNAILSKDSGALGQVENAYQPFSNLTSNLTSGAANIDQTIAQEQAGAQAANQAANGAITGQQSGLNTAVNNELATAQSNAAAQNAAVNSALSNVYGGVAQDNTATTLGTYGGGSTPWVNTTNYNVNPFSGSALTALGMTQDQANALQAALQQEGTSQYMTGHNFGAGSGTSEENLANYNTQIDPTTAFTAGNVATPEQYAEQQAFQTLLGSLPTGAVLDPTQAAMAGTAPTSTNTFNYQQALTDAQNTAAAQRSAAQAEASGLTSGADLAHAQSQHNGVFNKIVNAVTPSALLYALNPLLAVPKEQQLEGKLTGKAP